MIRNGSDKFSNFRFEEEGGGGRGVWEMDRGGTEEGIGGD